MIDLDEPERVARARRRARERAFDATVDALLADPRLCAVELTWSSGIVVATKRAA